MVYSGEQLRVYMANRRARIKQEMRDLLGGVCTKCGVTEDLQFDHIDPATKTFQISGRGLDKPLAVLVNEVAKCQLLCVAHHREKTLRDLGHEPGEHGLRTYNHAGCRCDICRAAKRASRVRAVTGDTKAL